MIEHRWSLFPIQRPKSFPFCEFPFDSFGVREKLLCLCRHQLRDAQCGRPNLPLFVTGIACDGINQYSSAWRCHRQHQ
jgi:hypothetical protein